MNHKAMNAAGTVSARGKIAHSLWVLGRRRRFLVPGPYQLRSILNVGVLALVLLGGFNLVFYKLLSIQSADAVQVAPELSAVIHGQDGYQMKLMVLASIVAFLGIMATALFETHKTAGPLFNLVQTMQKLTKDGPAVRVRFRKEDHFREVEAAFNAMATSLEAQALQRSEEIAKVSDALRQEAEKLAAGGAPIRDAASRLDELAKELSRIG